LLKMSLSLNKVSYVASPAMLGPYTDARFP